MVGLIETSVWEPEIRQLETTDPVLGGPPNLGAGEGYDNIGPQQLANRTLFLYNLLGGAAEASVTITDLDALTRPGLYHYDGNSTSAPNIFEGFVHHARTIGGAGLQEATDSAGGRFVRSRPTGGNWTSWFPVWSDQSVGITHSNTGGLKFPDGTEIKIGRGATTGDRTQFTFPIAFDTECFSVILCDGTQQANPVTDVATLGVEVDTIARTRFIVRGSASSTFFYVAFGR